MARLSRVLGWLGVAAASSVAWVACSDDGTDGDVIVGPCETVYEGECGKACQVDVDCADGLYCGTDDKCTADCSPGGGECGPGVACTARGRCEGSSGEGGSGGNGSTGSSFGQGGSGQGGSGEGGACPAVEVVFAPTTPTVVLLIDQSGSMTADFGGQNRWDALYDTLMDPTDGIVSQLEDQVRFGLALYTGDGGGNCPLLSEVDIAIGNRDAIDAVYSPAAPIGETPTGDSIDAILPELLAFAEPGPKVIVLATDGEPDTCEVPNPQNGQAEAIAAAQNAYGEGVSTYIIAVGGAVSTDHQQDMANAGVGLAIDGSQGDAPYYQALDQAALTAAFDEIINGVRSCVLTLSQPIDPERADEGQVFIDGNEVPQGAPDGWIITAPDTVELLGEACATIQVGDHEVTGTFPCGSDVIPE